MANPNPRMDRTQGIGGADVGSLFGLNHWKSLPELWLEKTGRLPPDYSDSLPKLLGRLFEEPVAKAFALQTGRRVQKTNRLLIHPRYRFMTGHPDRFQWDTSRSRRRAKGVLEIKTTHMRQWHEWSHGGIPAQYYLQLQHYLVLTGCQWGSFAVLFGGQKLVHFDLDRDEAVIAVMLEKEAAFWQLVETQQMPPIELSEEWNQVIAQFFPKPNKGEEKIVESPEAIGRAQRYLQLKDQITRRKEESIAHEVWFKSEIAHAESLLVPGIARFTWKASERKHVDLAALREEHLEWVEALTKTVPTRIFHAKALAEDPFEDSDDEAA